MDIVEIMKAEGVFCQSCDALGNEIERLRGLVDLLQTSSREWREAHDRLQGELTMERTSVAKLCDDYNALSAELTATQARASRMAELMRKLREPEWHFESRRDFQRELNALEQVALDDDTALKAALKQARIEGMAQIANLIGPVLHMNFRDDIRAEIEKERSNEAENLEAGRVLGVSAPR